MENQEPARRVVSTQVETVEELLHEGWRIAFVYKREGYKNPDNVAVSGRRENPNMTINGSMNSNNTTSIVFSSGPFDAELAGIVALEMASIMNPPVPVEQETSTE